MTRLDTDLLRQGLDALAAADPAFGAARARIGDPALRRWEPGFATLLDIIIGQQVSTMAARAIKARLRQLVAPLTPERLLAAGPEVLRQAGFSRQKMTYAADLAGAITAGRLDLDALAALDDEAAIAALTAIRGIGRWTAEIYLLFALGRPDVWPADDLALADSLRHLRGMADRPKGKLARSAAEGWQPWRGAAAHFCWHLYHHNTGRIAVPVAPVPEETA